MRVSSLRRNQIVCAAAFVAAGLAMQSGVKAETWVGGDPTLPTDWNTAANWSPATVPDGITGSANFSLKDIVGTESVTVTTGVTINNMTFGDAAGADGSYALSGANFALGGTTPTFTVNNTVNAPVTIANIITGTGAGFTKSGAGTLTLTGVNTFTGGITVNGGTLDTSAAIGTVARQFVTLTNGGTWKFASGTTTTNGWGLGGSTGQPPTFVVANGGLFVAAGQTGTVTNAADVHLGQVGGGAGSTLNVVIANGTTFNARGSWRSTTTANTGGELGTLNISVPTAGNTANFVFNSNPNANSNDRFSTTANGSAAFANTVVTMGDGITAWARTGSAGNTYTIGSLTGAATTTLMGSRSAGGGEANYVIGGLNTNTTFAGTITSETTLAVPTNGTTNITKVGTGTLTLSGNLTYLPSSTNATFARKGGVMTVSAGTLALSNGAFAPVGESATNPTTINVQSAGTLDVSGTTRTFLDSAAATVVGYSTVANQQVIGAGTIKGVFNLADGNLAPANTMGTSTSILNVPVTGTLTINGKLNFMAADGNVLTNSGRLTFDINSAGTSDLINVTDADLSGKPTLALNRIGATTAGSYTILNSTNNLTGSAANWVVQWAGRGTTPTLDSTSDPKKLQLVVAPTSLGGNINWRGTTDGTWDIQGTSNWHNTAVSFTNPDKYYEGDTVSFLDTYDGVNPVANTAITLNVGVTPTSVLVNSNTTNYSLAGTGKITGATTVTKQGTSTLTLSTANDYSGTTTITGGTIIGTIGSGGLLLNGGSYIANNNATIPATTTVTGAGNGITTAGSGTSSISSLAGTGSLTLTQASGTTDIVGNNAGFSGTVTLAGTGTVRVGNGAASSGANAWVINSGILATNQLSTGSTDLGSLAGSGGTLTGGQGGSTPAAGTVRTWNIGSLNTSTTFAGSITDGKSPSITALNKVGTGTLELTGTLAYTGSTTVSGGVLKLTNAIQPVTGATIALTGGTMEVATNGGYTGTTYATSFAITSPNGRLELHDNDLIINYGANPSVYNDVVNWVKSGLTSLGGAGTTGISSSEVNLNTVPGTSLAVVDDLGTIGTLPGGFPIVNPAQSVIVKFTWLGDANLDGIVDGTDYALTDSGFAGGGTTWNQGDYNYSGGVDGTDYALIDTGFGSQSGSLPEPTALGLLGLGAMGMLRRRRQA